MRELVSRSEFDGILRLAHGIDNIVVKGIKDCLCMIDFNKLPIVEMKITAVERADGYFYAGVNAPVKNDREGRKGGLCHHAFVNVLSTMSNTPYVRTLPSTSKYIFFFLPPPTTSK